MLQKFTLLAAVLCLVACTTGPDSGKRENNSPYPWYDPAISFEERVQMLIDSMTVEEKISQLTHDAAGIERLGVPDYNWWSEALHGVARNGRATVFPEPIGLAATFDRDLIHRIFTAVSDEARAKFLAAQKIGNRGQYAGLTFWTPNVNLFRDPRWGRGMETYGEDPYLTAQLGMEVVRGLQGDDPKYLKTGACAKHYAVHSGPEALRHEFDAVPSLKDLHETYLPAFKALVTETRVESVMGAYNRVYGEPACASQLLLEDILLHDWGFRGHILSDCEAISDFNLHHKITADLAESAALALNHGVSLNCGYTYRSLGEALERGLINEDTIDRRLATLMITRFRLGLFDPPSMNPYSSITEEVINSAENRALAREAAVKSVVMLKNNGVLPLKKDLRKLFVTGPQANNGTVLLGNYFGVSDRLVNILEGITGKVSPGTTVGYRMGTMAYMPNVNPMDWSTRTARESDVTIAVMGISQLLEGEEGESLASPTKGDRYDLNLPAHQLEYLRNLRENNDHPIIVVMTGGSPITMPEVEELADAILWVWYPGEEGGDAVADVLFGDVSPSGKLPITFPVSTEQLPDYEDYSMKERTYRYMTTDPLYPFGYGLSYTDFYFSKLKLDRDMITPGGSLNVSVDIKNAGDFDADEIVQLYVTVPDVKGNQPRWSLKNFERITLRKGAHTVVSFKIDRDELEQFDEEGKTRVVPGEYCVYVGNSSPGDRGRELGSRVLTATFQVR